MRSSNHELIMFHVIAKKLGAFAIITRFNISEKHDASICVCALIAFNARRRFYVDARFPMSRMQFIELIANGTKLS